MPFRFAVLLCIARPFALLCAAFRLFAPTGTTNAPRLSNAATASAVTAVLLRGGACPRLVRMPPAAARARLMVHLRITDPPAAAGTEYRGILTRAKPR